MSVRCTQSAGKIDKVVRNLAIGIMELNSNIGGAGHLYVNTAELILQVGSDLLPVEFPLPVRETQV